jgi:predicted nucleic acid-binding protein
MNLFLVDTNVMIAASAVNELSRRFTDAMPEEVELRELAYEWLASFDQSDNWITLDEEGLIRDEYDRNLPFNAHGQEYGMQVLQNKHDRNQVIHLPIKSLDANGEHIAVLDPEHEELVKDREDRKWVATAISARTHCDVAPPIVYGAETDWYVAEKGLISIGLCFLRLLPKVWYESRTDT